MNTQPVNSNKEALPVQAPPVGGKEKPPLKPWQKKRLWAGILSVIVFGTTYLGLVCTALWKDRAADVHERAIHTAMGAETMAELDARSKDATQVQCGTYVESIKSLSLRDSNFRLVLLVWFRWQGMPDLDMKENFHFYKGAVNSTHLVEESHEKDIHYQLLRVDVTMTKDFSTNRFPLDSQQLNLYLECDYPIEEVRLRLDPDSSINSAMRISGYRILEGHVQEYCHKYDSVHGDPKLSQPNMSSELVTTLEISRDGLGLYMKCFIALFGTTLWVFITMFLCTYHRVDPLGMIPAALFGSVSNIMVGANLLPDALHMGLLEYVNMWGVATILAGALCIISINRIRTRYKDHEFAALFGRVMFGLIVAYVVAGHLLMPLCAYAF